MDPMAPSEGWWGGTVTLNLTASIIHGAAYVVTPREIGRLTDVAVCGRPIHIQNGFYEYLQFGRGLEPKPCRSGLCGNQLQAYERDNAVTFAPLLVTPQQIRVYPTDIRDTALRVLIQGKDQNRQIILTTDPGTGQAAPGEYLQLAFPFSTTVNQFSTITGIQKDQTYGPLQFFQVNLAGVESPLSAMEPNEGVASYRRYLVNGIPSHNLCCTSPAAPLRLTAQGRLDFIPVQNETDYLTIPCVPALIEESQSVRYSKMDSGNATQQSLFHHARALSLLNGQLDSYEGKVNTAISVPIFGSRRLRRQPV